MREFHSKTQKVCNHGLRFKIIYGAQLQLKEERYTDSASEGIHLHFTHVADRNFIHV